MAPGNGDEAEATCLARRARRALAASHFDPATIRADRAGEDLDEGAFAGAVGAHERVDLAGPDGKRRITQRDDGPVGLRDTARVEHELSRRVRHVLLDESGRLGQPPAR